MTVATGQSYEGLSRHMVQVMAGDELVTTTEAAKRLGISARTLQRYVTAGLITPDLTLPSGRYRWDVDRLRAQINAIPRKEVE